MKIFWLFNHPAPYKVDLFNELGKSIELDVLFERASEKGRNAIFYGEKALSFHAEIANSLPIGGANNLTFVYKKYLKDPAYDVVVLNGWSTLTEQLAIHYCKKRKIPYVFYINGGIKKEGEPRWLRKRKTSSIQGASSYLAPDLRSAEYLEFYGADPSKIHLYPYSSIYESELSKEPLSREEKAVLRKELGLAGKNIYVCSSQFIERKNNAQLIALWCKMPMESTLLLTGEGPLKEAYLKQIEELKLTNVKLLPYLPHKDLFRLYRACDAAVILSKEDIYGHVINEALSQGLPVVATENMNAALHLLENGKNGFVVSLEDEEGILKALNQILAPSFIDAALETARNNTLEVSARAHLAFFESYLTEKQK